MSKQSKSSMTVAEAGQRGGVSTNRRYGHQFYEEIGSKGGKIGGPRGGRRVKELIKEGKKVEKGTNA